VDKIRNAATFVSAQDVVLKMRIDYSRGVRDQMTKNLEGVCGLSWRLEQPNLDPDVFMKEMAELITKLWSIDGVAIGVWDPTDRLYKYRAIAGFDKESEDGYKKLAYTKEQLLDPSVYPSYEISKHTRLFLAEDHPYAEGEEFTYRRPGLIGMKRRDPTDSMEADYLDSFCYGPDGEVLAYIEISGTRMRRLPDTATIRWMELMAVILGVAIQRKRVS